MSNFIPPAGSDAFALLNIISDPSATRDRLQQLLELQTTAGQQMDAARQAQVEADKLSKEVLSKESSFNEYVSSTTKGLEVRETSVSNRERETAEANAQALDYLKSINTLKKFKEEEIASLQSSLEDRSVSIQAKEKALEAKDIELTKLQASLEDKLNKLKAII